METLTQEDLKNIGILISKANITGAEATTVAILLQKINTLLQPKVPQETKEDLTKGKSKV